MCRNKQKRPVEVNKRTKTDNHRAQILITEGTSSGCCHFRNHCMITHFELPPNGKNIVIIQQQYCRPHRLKKSLTMCNLNGLVCLMKNYYCLGPDVERTTFTCCLHWVRNVLVLTELKSNRYASVRAASNGNPPETSHTESVQFGAENNTTRFFVVQDFSSSSPL